MANYELFSKKQVALGNRRMGQFRKLVEKQNLNMNKVMCLLWQSETGKKCTNRNHLKGEYKNKLECEATLTESLALHIKLSGINEKDFKSLLLCLKQKN